MTTTHIERLRSSAAAAAVVLAVLSRGDALVLGALLVVVAWRPASLVVVPALLASSWRWGSTSLDALAGAQAVLGPAGFVGPPAAASASWLAGVAILLAVPGVPGRVVGGMEARWARAGAPNVSSGLPGRVVGGMEARWARAGAPNVRLVAALPSSLASGAAVAAVVVGPAPGGEIWARAVAAVVASMAALGLGVLRARGARTAHLLDGVVVVAAVGALIAVAPTARGWSGILDIDAFGEGVAVAVAVVALAEVGGWAGRAMRGRRA